jgi:hypothetical protein
MLDWAEPVWGQSVRAAGCLTFSGADADGRGAYLELVPGKLLGVLNGHRKRGQGRRMSSRWRLCSCSQG